MAATTDDSEGKRSLSGAADALAALIGRNLVRSLGTPDGLLKVQVRHVGNDRYRVNVLVGKDAASPRISDSFFLAADAEGNILKSSPPIARVY